MDSCSYAVAVFEPPTLGRIEVSKSKGIEGTAETQG